MAISLLSLSTIIFIREMRINLGDLIFGTRRFRPRCLFYVGVSLLMLCKLNGIGMATFFIIDGTRRRIDVIMFFILSVVRVKRILLPGFKGASQFGFFGRSGTIDALIGMGIPSTP